MQQEPLVRYLVHSAVLAAVLCAVWCLWQLVRHKAGTAPRMPGRQLWLRLAFLFYLVELAGITVLRDGAEQRFWLQPHSMASVRLVLLQTTLQAWRGDLSTFLYHTCGNIGCFVPLGLLGPLAHRQLRHPAVLFGAALLLTMGIEAGQWLLATGITDIDDVLLNLLGAMLGWALWRMGSALAAKK